jgi:hypothetical protein
MKILALDPIMTFIDKKLSIYRVHGSSMSHQRKKMRKGFIMAVKKQQKLFFHNKGMNILLKEQLKKIKWRYREESPFDRIWHRLSKTFHRAYVKSIPWPIQKICYRIMKGKFPA